MKIFNLFKKFIKNLYHLVYIFNITFIVMFINILY